MSELIHFDPDLYTRDALELAARKYAAELRLLLADRDRQLVAELEPVDPRGDWPRLRTAFCNEALSATARALREAAARGEADGAPWSILAPFRAGEDVSHGWALATLAPVRNAAATLVLRHDEHGTARVAVRRRSGTPLGIAHTEQLDFLLLNGGNGSAPTEESIGRALLRLAQVLREHEDTRADAIAAAFRTSADGDGGAAVPPPALRRVAPRIDLEQNTIRFELPHDRTHRLSLYESVLSFADRAALFLSRPAADRMTIELRMPAEAAPGSLRLLAAEVTRALNQALSAATEHPRPCDSPRTAPRRTEDLASLLGELRAADPATLGLGYQPPRGPGHENLRVLNIRGTGACNSDCIFCVEKFDPAHRSMPRADATRQLILDNGGKFEMLFFASGEPTIHPKLLEHVELARSVGFTHFGMSSHFRTLADPDYTLRLLQAGFRFFDISLHAADPVTQLAVNPIGDGGRSLWEALKGLAVLYRLADALGIRLSITHKIVVSRLNVHCLEDIFRATYDRGVRHFILQPVRAMNLEPARHEVLAISEEEILPHLNALLRRTEHLGATLKPYGFSRQHLFSGPHVESEQNRVKNVYGRVRSGGLRRALPASVHATAGAHRVEVRMSDSGHRFHFPSHGAAPLLDEALQLGFELPFGCRMGSCGMCCAKLLEGRVDQSGQFFLSEEQAAAGFVLLCQARPRSDVIVRLCTESELDSL